MATNYKVQGLNTLAHQLHQFQVEAGFTDSNITQRLMLIHSEISEAFEAFRKDKYAKLPEFEDLVSKSRIIKEDPAYTGTMMDALKAWGPKMQEFIMAYMVMED